MVQMKKERLPSRALSLSADGNREAFNSLLLVILRWEFLCLDSDSLKSAG